MNMKIALYHFPTIMDEVYTVLWLLKVFRSEIIREQNDLSMKTILYFQSTQYLKSKILKIQSSA